MTRKWCISSGSSSGRNARREIERAAVGIVQLDRTGRVDRRAVERGAQHEPPVERCPTLPALLFERARCPQAHERLLVVDEVGELLARERDVRGRVGVVRPRTPFDRDAAIVGGERPRLAVDLDGQRSGSDEGKRGHDLRLVLRRPAPAARRRRTPPGRTRRVARQLDSECTLWSLALRRCQCGFAGSGIGSAVALHEQRLSRRADAERRRLPAGYDRARRAGSGRRAFRACRSRACRARGGSAAR